MTTFNELIKQTATGFFLDELDAEDVIYTTATKVLLLADLLALATWASMGGDLKRMAVAGHMTIGEQLGTAPEERPIKAYIDRSVAADLNPAPYGHAPLMQAVVANDAVHGISSTELDLKTDRLKVALRPGETPQLRRITKILSQDAGMMTLGVR